MMINDTTIHVVIKDFINSAHAVATEDAQKLFETVAKWLAQGNKVTLDFADVETITGLFLAVAIGQLHKELSNREICKLLQVNGLGEDDEAMLNVAVRNALAYYHNPDGYNKAWNELEGEQQA